jgi:hypothetical protein
VLRTLLAPYSPQASASSVALSLTIVFSRLASRTHGPRGPPPRRGLEQRDRHRSVLRRVGPTGSAAQRDPRHRPPRCEAMKTQTSRGWRPRRSTCVWVYGSKIPERWVQPEDEAESGKSSGRRSPSAISDPKLAVADHQFFDTQFVASYVPVEGVFYGEPHFCAGLPGTPLAGGGLGHGVNATPQRNTHTESP